MFRIDPVAVFIVLLGSYLLVLGAAAKRKKPISIQGYLFFGNRATYAFSSGLGAMFSYSVAGTAMLSAGFVFGWQISFSLVSGALVGLLIYFKLLQQPTVQTVLSHFHRERHYRGASFVTVLAQSAGTKLHFLILPYITLIYVMLLAVELAVIKMTLGSILTLQEPEILLVVTAIVAVCYSYVFIGGYHGILMTDHFQLMVIAVFLVSILGVSSLEYLMSIPPPTQAVIKWNFLSITVLHFSVFTGALSISLSSLDHWYRTAGTLKLNQAKKVLVASAVVTSIGASLLVLLGSTAHGLNELPVGTTSDISLILLGQLQSIQNSTVQFFFMMALTCIALTTLDSYVMTIQQAYYELSSRIHAKTHHTYPWWQWPLKWRDARWIGLFALTLSFILSFQIPITRIYEVGVATASGFIPITPLLLSRAFNLKHSHSWKVMGCGFGSSLLLISVSLVLCALWLPSSLHLYIYTAAFSVSTIVGCPIGCAVATRLFFNPEHTLQ